jgi:hypothetical protein
LKDSKICQITPDLEAVLHFTTNTTTMRFGIFLLCFLSTLFVNAQNSKETIEKLVKLEDQYGNTFDKGTLGDEFTLLLVPTTNEPFRVYDQLKNAKLKPNVVLVGGFGNSGGHGGGMPIGHLKEGFNKKFGKEYLSVWLDAENSVFKPLGIKGHAILTITKKGKVLKKQDFGNKIDDFMKSIEPLKAN